MRYAGRQGKLKQKTMDLLKGCREGRYHHHGLRQARRAPDHVGEEDLIDYLVENDSHFR